MRAVEEVIETVCTKPDVRCVSFRQLADWLDAQDPKTLEKLRTLQVGEAPKAGLGVLPVGPARPGTQGRARCAGGQGGPGRSDGQGVVLRADMAGRTRVKAGRTGT